MHAGARGGSSFARSFDAFFYKRLKDVSEFTDASSLGAALTLAGGITLVVLFVFELLAFLVPVTVQSVGLAPASAEPLRISFNVSFPRVSCHILTLDTADAIGNAHVNISKNIVKYRYDSRTGKLLEKVQDAPLVLLYGEPDGARAPRNLAEAGAGSQEGAAPAPGSRVLTTPDFAAFIKDTKAALVTFGAPWCPWSRRLIPVWEEVAGIVNSVPDVRLGRVDCTDPAAAQLCYENHVNAYPTIVLYKGGAAHSHSHYHGNRTVDALLSFLVLAMEDKHLVTDASHNAANAAAGHDHAHGHGGDEGHDHVGRLVAEAAYLAEHADADVAAARAGVGDSHGEEAPVDPADPGPAWRLVEAMHAAGLKAPGDAARAVARMLGASPDSNATAGGNGTNAGDGGCAPSTAPLALADAGTAAAPEGCLMLGFVDVARVPGRLRVHVGGADGLSVAKDAVNMTHVVHDLWFGPRLTSYQLSRLPTGTDTELHRMRGARFVSEEQRVAHTHFLNVVAASFQFSTGHTVDTYKYTAHSHAVVGSVPSFVPASGPAGRTPEVLWKYELSPVAVVTTEARKPFYSFITSVCAIIGGVFTVIGLLDSLLHASLRSLRFKSGIGKQQ